MVIKYVIVDIVYLYCEYNTGFSGIFKKNEK